MRCAGDHPWGAGYNKLLQAMLGEAELHSHKDAHSAVWLDSMQPVLEVGSDFCHTT